MEKLNALPVWIQIIGTVLVIVVVFSIVILLTVLVLTWSDRRADREFFRKEYERAINEPTDGEDEEYQQFIDTMFYEIAEREGKDLR